MHTTIALQPATKEKLAELKRRWRLRSLDEVVDQLLAGSGSPKTAKQLFLAHRTAVMRILKEYGVTRMVAFGSRARGDARPDSDLDLMVDLPAGSSLFDQGSLLVDLQEEFGMSVDLVTEGPHLGRLNDRIKHEGVVLVG
ncbi:MAG TPA: nucleotidyltransferase domain-containing protein [Candidatus Thermoplasmatota archaeon]|nr:nucleotidyltransferase domain-containing protein [Candidatus Thermoplasmatota archaeon]